MGILQNDTLGVQINFFRLVLMERLLAILGHQAQKKSHALPEFELIPNVVGDKTLSHISLDFHHEIDKHDFHSYLAAISRYQH